MVGTAFVRDTAMMAAIFGVAAFMWFGILMRPDSQFHS